ncbi:ribonuclease HIII [Acetonema longum]|uniref:Ribonuclease n=1 Tax=Acetonema longum DSM 6540 TaxID=1009370 RepID=F7NPS3_9FIRM|nr:ribonuclease HIII [Acetonema longum]EGO61914.1 ribonuclease HIII [Acetonema longum DSM 6540]
MIENQLVKAKVDLLSVQFRNMGLTVKEIRPIDYGAQIRVTDETAVVTVNVYHGKKGISLTVGGSSGQPLTARVRSAVLGQPESAACPLPVPGQTARPTGFETVPDFDFRWIGSDESGKGDFFGPLVVAAVMVDETTAAQLTECGIKDCKLLSDDKVRAFAVRIRAICRERFVELELAPERYNALYQEFQAVGKNLNQLLAWGHARVLEELLGKVPCRFAIADQFAAEHQLITQLMEKGRQVTLVQIPRAERNIAVAAASVLARDRFLACLAALEEQFDMKFPKGASSLVVTAGRQFADRYDRASLPEVCKLHFRTVSQI